MSEVPKLSRSERLRLIAFRNVQERKIKKDKNMNDKEKRIAELEVLKNEISQNIIDFKISNSFTNSFTELDVKKIQVNVDNYYSYFLSNLTKDTDVKTETNSFNINMRNKIDCTEKQTLKDCLDLYIRFYNVKIEIDCKKIRNQ